MQPRSPKESRRHENEGQSSHRGKRRRPHGRHHRDGHSARARPEVRAGRVLLPDEGGDVEIEDSTLDGAPYDLTRQQERQAKDLLLEKAADDDGEREDPRDDYDRAEA